MQKIGILGGTFNPIHWGHLLMAESALEQAALDQVIWLPMNASPHKAQQDDVGFEHRLVMVQQAIAKHPAFTASAIEADRTGPSYAIATLKDLQKLHPQTQWFWIVGLDTFQTLPRWYGRQELVEACTWLVAPRPKASADQCGKAGDFNTTHRTSDSTDSTAIACKHVADALAAQSLQIRWQVLQMPIMEISSSLVRQYCRDRRSIRYLVPESVRIYLLAHQFYQEPTEI
jgi:nicotinate-nucleotide adenylyltransferase